MVKFFQDGWDLFIDWLDIYVTYRLHPSRKLITVFGVFTPVITIVIGYFINEMLKEFVPIFKTSYLVALKTLVTLDFIERHKYLYIYVGIALLFWICKNWIVSKYERESILHYGLYWFYTMMGYAHNQAADIRCTIWIPANKKKDCNRLIQAVDYVPIESQVLSDVDGQTQYWPYKKAGRSFRISKKRDGIVLPIGILGKCVKASIANCREDIIYADIPEDENYVEYLIKQWNFSKIMADRLTKGRQSFVCIPRMDSAKSRILFIIYLDARRGAIFDDLTEEKIEDHLRLITQTLTAE